MSVHQGSSPLAGKTVRIVSGEFAGQSYRVEDWWDRVSGKSWMDRNVDAACMEYAVRSGLERSPHDDEVLYGKIGPFGMLIHISQIGDVV